MRPWHAFYDEDVPRSLTYPPVTLHGLLEATARDRARDTATIYGGMLGSRLMDARLTWGDIGRLVDRFAAGLQALGVKKGDRVAIMLPNCPQFVIAFYGTLKAGAVVVPTNPLYTAPELRHQLEDSGAETLVVLSRSYAEAKQVASATGLRNVIVTNIKEYFPPLLRTLFTLAREKKDGHRASLAGDPRAIWFQDVLRRNTVLAPVDVAPADLAVLQYTGGTTGVPKGAMLSHRALVANVVQCLAWNGARVAAGRPECGLAVMPFFHVYGLTVVMNYAVLSGGAMILIPRFELHHILASIQKHRPQLFAGAPRIYVAVSNAPDLAKWDLRSIEAFISGSAPLPVEVQQRFEELTGGTVVEGYGLTEAGPVTHCNPRHGRRKLGTIGLPYPDVDAKIVDTETGTRDLSPGEAGELLVRGPNLMDGYYKRPDETALVLKDGWLYTGDIATMDAEGYFAIVDRKKELIIVAGYNVYPREVEEVLFAHPAVLEAAAIGIPDEEKGEVVKAFVVLRPGAEATGEQLIAHCRESLARFKVPVAIAFRRELPKSLIGKVLRRQLADEDRAARQKVG